MKKIQFLDNEHGLVDISLKHNWMMYLQYIGMGSGIGGIVGLCVLPLIFYLFFVVISMMSLQPDLSMYTNLPWGVFYLTVFGAVIGAILGYERAYFMLKLDQDTAKVQYLKSKDFSPQEIYAVTGLHQAFVDRIVRDYKYSNHDVSKQDGL
jgi:hypothetical protein